MPRYRVLAPALHWYDRGMLRAGDELIAENTAEVLTQIALGNLELADDDPLMLPDFLRRPLKPRKH